MHILDGNAPDLDSECASYEATIAEFGGINLFLAGIGPDGHIAFNEPGSSLESRTRVVGSFNRVGKALFERPAARERSFVFIGLAYDTIVANSRFFNDDLAQVPKKALTVGVATVMAAAEVLIIITGISKSIALKNCIEEELSHIWTASAIQLHEKGAHQRRPPLSFICRLPHRCARAPRAAHRVRR